ncbi:MAG: hypothetical protein FWG50_12245, partial [Kiritimatiellaeota bacterium]|nr:hypothetical protein [Kiritimatiellota bacterium]
MRQFGKKIGFAAAALAAAAGPAAAQGGPLRLDRPAAEAAYWDALHGGVSDQRGFDGLARDFRRSGADDLA